MQGAISTFKSHIATLLVTVLAGIVVFYFTVGRQNAPKPQAGLILLSNIGNSRISIDDIEKSKVTNRFDIINKLLVDRSLMFNNIGPELHNFKIIVSVGKGHGFNSVVVDQLDGSLLKISNDLEDINTTGRVVLEVEKMKKFGSFGIKLRMLAVDSIYPSGESNEDEIRIVGPERIADYVKVE